MNSMIGTTIVACRRNGKTVIGADSQATLDTMVFKDGVKVVTQDLFGMTENMEYCPGCRNGGFRSHNGIYCLIRDWGLKDPKTGENNRKIRFIDLIR